MITAMTPFREDMDLGQAYNDAMSKLSNPWDWAVLMDHDMMFTTPRWYPQVAEAVACVGVDAPVIFSAVTNRCGAPYQRAQESDRASNDVATHRIVGKARLTRRTLLDVTDTMGVAGVVFVLSKKTWHRAGGFRHGLFCVDHQMHYANRDAGGKTYLIEGLYVYHHRSSSGDREMVANAPRATEPDGSPCRCRGVVAGSPAVRLTLP
jgi:GT2 family glycosyltransferase